MILVDAMAHLHGPEAGRALERARAVGVGVVVAVHPNPLSAPEPPAASSEDVLVVRAFGLGPAHIDAFAITAQLDALGELIQRDDAVALGAVGVDLAPGMPPEGLQRLVLQTQLQLARQAQIPALIRCGRGGVECALELLSDVGPLPAGGVLFGLTGPKKPVRRALRLGLAIGITADELGAVDVARFVPPERLLVGSGGSASVPSDPAVIPELVDKLAAVRRDDPGELGREIAANARRVLRLP